MAKTYMKCALGPVTALLASSVVAVPLVHAQTVADTLNIVSMASNQTTLDARTPSVTVVLTNPAKKDTAHVELSVRYAPPRPYKALVSGGFMAEDDSATKERDAEVQRIDSLATLWSLESWIDSLPRQVKIPPNGTRTMTFKVNAPATAKPGEYSAHIIATTAVIAKPNFGPGGSVVTLPSGAGVKGGNVDLKNLELIVFPPEGSWPRRSLNVVYRVPSNP